jgi:YD repeat-containing protein
MIVLSTLIAVAAFAAEGGSGRISLDSAVKVDTIELPVGDYRVTWTGSGSSTEVTLTQGKTKVTLPAQVVQVRRRSDALSTRRENDSRVLTEIQFRRRPWCCRIHRAR